MAIELANYLKIPSGFKRQNCHKDLLDVVRGWEREGWRGRSARLNQLLMERDGTNIQEVGNTTRGLRSFCNPSRSCICLALIIMILLLVVIFERNF